jgi:hypothetical protein
MRTDHLIPTIHVSKSLPKKTRGVYFIANDAAIDNTIAFLNSFRLFNPKTQLCLVPFDESIDKLLQLRQVYRFFIWSDEDILRRCDDVSRAFHGVVHGHYRKLALWSGPFDEFIYIDTDTIVLEAVGFVFEYLQRFEFVASHSNVRSIRKWVWKDSIDASGELSKHQIAYATNTGFICSVKNAMSIEIANQKLIPALGITHHMQLDCVEQPFLNYLIVTSGLRYSSLHAIFLESPSISIPLERWGGSLIKTIDKGKVILPKYPRTFFVHWAGEWRRARAEGTQIINYDLWRFYREMNSADLYK